MPYPQMTSLPTQRYQVGMIARKVGPYMSRQDVMDLNFLRSAAGHTYLANLFQKLFAASLPAPVQARTVRGRQVKIMPL